MNRVTQRRGRLARWTAHLPGGAGSLPLALPWALWCWAVITTAVVVCAVLVAVVPGLARRRRLARFFARAVLVLGGVRLGVGDTSVLPATGCIVVANHASYLDGIILTAALPPAFSFVIKKEITRVPVAHFLLRRLGSEFVDRFDARRGAADVRRLFRKAGDARALAVFPEGTFRAQPGLMAFRRTAFTLACRADLPVIPVTIRGARQVLPAGTWMPWPGPVSVLPSPPLPPRPAREATALGHAAREEILARLWEPDLAPPSGDMVPGTAPDEEAGARIRQGPAEAGPSDVR